MAPFARAGLHVEREEVVPHRFGEVAAGEPVHGHAVRQRLMALAAYGLALARGERGEEFVEARIALIFPVELLVGALQESEFAEETKFRLSRERHVNARGAFDAAKLDQTGRQHIADFSRMRSRPHQQPAPARRRERHRHLQLRVITSAGALIGFGPAAVEDVFAARVAFEVAGRGAKQRAVRVFDQHVLNMPAGMAAHRFRGLQRRKKTVRQKRIEYGIFRIRRLRIVRAGWRKRPKLRR